MKALSLLIAMFLGVTVASEKGNETSLSILTPELHLGESLVLTCGGIGKAPHHPLARVSWVLIKGKFIDQLPAPESGKLNLTIFGNMTNATVVCRSHARVPRHHVVMAASPLQLRIAGGATHDSGNTERDKLAIVDVSVRINSTSYKEGASSYNMSVGETIVIVCEPVNLSVKHVNYVYLLKLNVAGDVESEIKAAILTDPPRQTMWAKLKVSAEDHNIRVYCLVRWFENTVSYELTTAIRSKSILLVNPDGQDCGYPYLWVAIGVGALGWLLAVTSLGVMCFRRRYDDNVSIGDSSMELDNSNNRDSGGCGCFSSNKSTSGPLGATILPTENAHSLAAANIKLTPQSSPSVQHETVVYSNVEEINALLKRNMLRRH